MKRSNKRGYTLVELAVAGTMTAAVGGALLLAAQGLGDAFETGAFYTYTEQFPECAGELVDAGVLSSSGA